MKIQGFPIQGENGIRMIMFCEKGQFQLNQAPKMLASKLPINNEQ